MIFKSSHAKSFNFVLTLVPTNSITSRTIIWLIICDLLFAILFSLLIHYNRNSSIYFNNVKSFLTNHLIYVLLTYTFLFCEVKRLFKLSYIYHQCNSLRLIRLRRMLRLTLQTSLSWWVHRTMTLFTFLFWKLYQ